jgi:pilus assembly protein CpaE
MRKIKILISSRSREAAEQAAVLLDDFPGCEAEIRVGSNGHVDPLHGVASPPDLLMLCDILADGEMQTLAEMPASERPALIVFGTGQDPESMRLAMRAGARDFLKLPLQKHELFDLLEKISVELQSKAEHASGSLHVFINGKGGSGASFLASNIAHGLATSNQRVTLVDLDLQFAGLCRYLDLSPARDLIDAVQTVDDMDEVSARAFTSEHESGLRLLSCKADNLHLDADIQPQQLVKLLRTYQSFNDFVIVDLPRHIDIVSTAVLDAADRISVVMQQSFPNLHDTVRLMQILRNELGIDNSRLTVIVNRYLKDSAIQLDDIEQSLRVDKVVKIPNHYRSTSESVNSGVPLMDVTRRSAVIKGLRDYYQSFGGISEDATAGGRLQSLFRRS